jgi:hypothetical protein
MPFTPDYTHDGRHFIGWHFVKQKKISNLSAYVYVQVVACMELFNVKEFNIDNTSSPLSVTLS